MNWSLLFNRDNSAPVACERLQILLAHERSALGRSNLISDLKEEILAAISRHVAVEPTAARQKAVQRRSRARLLNRQPRSPHDQHRSPPHDQGAIAMVAAMLYPVAR